MSNEPNKSGTKPAIQHSKSILDDRRIRLLLAIVGAIVAWMVVTIVVQPGTTKTIANVPVDFTYDSAAYTSRGLSIGSVLCQHNGRNAHIRQLINSSSL